MSVPQTEIYILIIDLHRCTDIVENLNITREFVDDEPTDQTGFADTRIADDDTLDILHFKCTDCHRLEFRQDRYVWKKKKEIDFFE